MKKNYNKPQTDLFVVEVNNLMQQPLVVSFGTGGTTPGEHLNGDD